MKDFEKSLIKKFNQTKADPLKISMRINFFL